MKKETFEKILAMGSGFDHIESISPTSGKVVYTESYDSIYHAADGVLEFKAKHEPNPAQAPLSYFMEIEQVEYVRLKTEKITSPYA